MTPDQLVTFKKGGYYSTKVGGYRILLLNTLLYYRWNPLTQNVNYDIGDQFKFMQDQLSQASANKENVLIAGHIAPGKNEYDNSV